MATKPAPRAYTKADLPPRPTLIDDAQAYGIREVAAALDLSEQAVYGLLREEKLRPSKIGARTVVVGAEIRRFTKSLMEART